MEVPPNEAERLAALVNYGILDSEFEESFDRITRIAAAIFGAPIALVSLVDGYRQWFKSALGLSVRETARDISFCTHAILGTQVFEVADATKDPRFINNPLVLGEPKIRFYAGAPLMTPDGYAVGTMCVIDRKAHVPLTTEQKSALADLSGLVVDQMEARRSRRNTNLAIKRAGEAMDNLRCLIAGEVSASELTKIRDGLDVIRGLLRRN